MYTLALSGEEYTETLPSVVPESAGVATAAAAVVFTVVAGTVVAVVVTTRNAIRWVIRRSFIVSASVLLR
jgi:hypothetical protein